ncbi:2-hydroxyacid dehydrogenase [Roseibium sediminicola]|uniref:Glyoxylate/hydroxypyruvate reductase A n=1 Tax=Roseibium sediminicola TaxID=2933272 RepID=A0ABT0GUZ6_9HYPH|nr:glyoxylate/hydroxypyruvate reductase A [Roseibium sp. CAU 1639]MCK7613251.1 glyoxylate/hydroxypyruvate reductase A [Roseibium sp. CAU 1639]
MTVIVPFVSEASQDERQAWCEALPEALSGVATVKPFEDLTDEERKLATVAIVANPDPAKVAALPNLVWVQSLWAGVERLTAELPADGPLIVRLTDPQMAETMSEAVLAWTLYLHRDMPRYRVQQDRKIWQGHELKLPGEQTVGMLGLGKLGAAAALRLKANGFSVLGWSRSAKALTGIACHHGADGLRTVLERSDILVLLMPLTEDTKGLIGQDELSACKEGAALINFARGPILDEPALLAALDNGPLGHAVLDVFDKEPLPASHPFWTHAKVTLLPHISAPTITSTASKIVAANIGGYLAGGTVPPSVDRSRGY